MKKYILFGGRELVGGWGDYKNTSDDLNKLKAIIKMNSDNLKWWHIIDRDTMAVIEESRFHW